MNLPEEEMIKRQIEASGSYGKIGAAGKLDQLTVTVNGIEAVVFETERSINLLLDRLFGEVPATEGKAYRDDCQAGDVHVLAHKLDSVGDTSTRVLNLVTRLQEEL